MPEMKKVLLHYYPDELSQGQASDLAIELCSIKLNVPDENTIKYMMQRSLGDRRR